MLRLAVAFALSLLPLAAYGQYENRPAIQQGCQSSTNWTQSACSCIADAAMELTPAQQVYLVAILTEDKAAATLAAAMKPPEVLEATMFMMKSGPACQ